MEKFKPISGYEGRYEISNLGNVKSVARVVVDNMGRAVPLKERILKTNKNNHGYTFVVLSKEGIITPKTVHRLVGTHWVENPNNYPEVGHNDGNKDNNSAINLSWQTRKENMNHAMVTGLIKGKSVLDIKTGEIFSSIGRAARKNGYKHQTLIQMLSGKQKNKSNLILITQAIELKQALNE